MINKANKNQLEDSYNIQINMDVDLKGDIGIHIISFDTKFNIKEFCELTSTKIVSFHKGTGTWFIKNK